jgi:hypothetical protein
VAFFGDGAVNQGMVMEAWNLAAVWKLPVLFVVKDNRWAVTTRSDRLRAGTIAGRARSFQLATAVVDGNRPAAVWHSAGTLVAGARRRRPGVLVARCRRPTGHMLDDSLTRTVRSPAEMIRVARELVRAQGGVLGIRRMIGLGSTVSQAFLDRFLPHRDPLAVAARAVGDDAKAVEDQARADVEIAVRAALETAGVAS